MVAIKTAQRKTCLTKGPYLEEENDQEDCAKPEDTLKKIAKAKVRKQ